MSAEYGTVYLMISAAMPGLVKIGATTKDPLQRARELSAATSSAVPFVVGYSRLVRFPFQVEAALHRIFDIYRTHDSREFFRIELHKVIEMLERYDEVRDLFHGGEVKTPYAELFSSFPDDDSPRELTEDERFKCEQLRYRLKHQG